MTLNMKSAARKGTWLPLLVPLFLSLALHTDAQLAFTLTSVTGSGLNLPYDVAVADINGDGSLDLIAANFGGITLKVFTNNGSGLFGSNATMKFPRNSGQGAENRRKESRHVHECKTDPKSLRC